MRHPPGPRGREVLQFFGNGSISGTVDFLRRTAKRHGPLASFRILHKRMYLVDDAELVREILTTRQHEFVRDSGATLLRELVGDGLLTREEPLHRERRRVLQPAFHRDQIASYASAMTAESERTADEWNGREEIDIRQEMRQLTLSIVGATLFGSDFRECAPAIARVLKRVVRRSAWLAPAFALIEPVALAYRRMWPHGPSLFFRKERAELERILTPLISERRSHSSRDILSLILSEKAESGKSLSDEDVRNEIVTFVLAGHETTAAALVWTFCLLSENPEAAEAVYAEVDAVAGTRSLQLADVPRLSYTTRVFQEAMRLYPPAVLFARRPKQDIDFAGYRIRKGESIFLSPYITQRNPKYFDRPDTFDPGRWEGPEPPKYSYFPFGGGAKMCIGEQFARMEGVLALAAISQRWQLKRTDQTALAFNGALTLGNDQPIQMRLASRRPAPELNGQTRAQRREEFCQKTANAPS